MRINYTCEEIFVWQTQHVFSNLMPWFVELILQNRKCTLPSILKMYCNWVLTSWKIDKSELSYVSSRTYLPNLYNTGKSWAISWLLHGLPTSLMGELLALNYLMGKKRGRKKG